MCEFSDELNQMYTDYLLHKLRRISRCTVTGGGNARVARKFGCLGFRGVSLAPALSVGGFAYSPGVCVGGFAVLHFPAVIQRRSGISAIPSLPWCGDVHLCPESD